jgi:hypothetical protein
MKLLLEQCVPCDPRWPVRHLPEVRGEAGHAVAAEARHHHKLRIANTSNRTLTQLSPSATGLVEVRAWMNLIADYAIKDQGRGSLRSDLRAIGKPGMRSGARWLG